jgi:hypothetical protein
LLDVGIYWNVLSAHNVLISPDGVKIIDFGESGPVELHDHVAMLSWLMHDIQVWRADSYVNGVYLRIHEAGGDRAQFHVNRFHASNDFFSPQLRWIYDALMSASSFAAFLSDPMLAQRVTRTA